MEHGLRIGVVAQAAGLSPKTIRYYEEIGLIPPPRRRAGGYASRGHRLFTQEDIQQLTFIRRARLLDLSLDQIQELLAAVQMGCCGAARPQLQTFLAAKLPEVEQRIAELKALRHALERLYETIRREAETCPPRATVGECGFGEGLVALDGTSPPATSQGVPRKKTTALGN